MGGDYLGEVIADFAMGRETPKCIIWFHSDRYNYEVTWREVADTCARLVGEGVRSGANDAEAEKRLRRLVSVMLELKSLGLVE